MTNIEHKNVSGHIVECKQEARNGIPIGIVKGHIATFDVDRTNDQFIKGAFLESIREHIEKKRPIRMLANHQKLIGGFPIETVKEDNKGLFAIGEINLEIQEGREIFSLAKQGILSDFSIGFTSIDDEMVDGIRQITRAIIWEGSIVGEPGNIAAKITEIKSVVPFLDLPLADQSREWNADDAMQRIKDFTESEEQPSRTFLNGFLHFDAGNGSDFNSYQLPIADISNGKLVAVPRAIFAVAGKIIDGTDGVPPRDKDKVKQNIERYYAKMGLDSPFTEAAQAPKPSKSLTIDEVKDLPIKDLEKLLRDSGSISKKAAKYLVSTMKNGKPELGEDGDKSMTEQEVKDYWESQRILQCLKSMKKAI